MSSLFFIIRLLQPNDFVLPYAICSLSSCSSFFRTRVTVYDISYTTCFRILSAFRFRLSGFQSAFANRQSYCRNLFSKLYTPTLLSLPLQATESKMQINSFHYLPLFKNHIVSVSIISPLALFSA